MKTVTWSSLNISILSGATVAEMAANIAHMHTKRYRNLNELPSSPTGRPGIKNREVETGRHHNKG
jgi:hypothetical protein